jgi:radical SAM protein with 4Fe4S-binding SPASM domain
MKNNIILAKKVVIRTVNGIAYTYDHTTGKALVFNAPGSFILSRLSQLIEIDKIVNDFATHFGISATEAKESIAKFFEILKKNFILELDSESCKLDHKNELKESNHAFLKFTIDNLIPLSGHFELTYKCNFNCIHCYNVKGKYDELSFIEIENILTDLSRAGTLFLTFSGGEIFVRQDWLNILSCAKDLGFLITVLSNGSLIERNMINDLKRLNLSNLQVSFLAVNKEKFSTITGSNSFERVKTNIRLLRDSDINVSIGVTGMECNFEDIDEIRSFGESNDVSVKIGYFIVPKNNGDLSPLKYRLSSSKLRQLLEKSDNGNSLEKTISLFGDHICSAGLNQYLITPEGEVHPCIQIPMRCGSLREASFQHIWQTSTELAFIRSMKVEDLKVCSSCAMYNFCDRCIGVAYLETGNILDVSPYNCAIAKFNYERRKK